MQIFCEIACFGPISRNVREEIVNASLLWLSFLSPCIFFKEVLLTKIG